MKKNKNGFTLVELLAVVIILIIIILIAVNVVRKNVDKSLDNAIVANAGMYVKAVNEFVQVESIGNPDLKEGFFSTTQLETLGVKISGTKPDSGKVAVSDRRVSSACLKYEEYFVMYDNGEVSQPKKGTCDNVSIGVFNFDYTGSYQEFTAPSTGEYKIELWGASGYSDLGKGAYTSGVISLNSDDILYIYVGGSGSASTPGYNGGGSGRNGETLGDKYGGGATDVRYFASDPSAEDLESNSFNGLKSRIMVAGGGGGAIEHSTYTYGNAGGLTGYTFVDSSYTSNTATGGSQTAGGVATNYNCSTYVATPGSFGQGGIAGSASTGGSGGGGGGYYGGSGGPRLCSGSWGGGGGSSFISGYSGCNAISQSSTSTAITHTGSPNHYSGLVFTDGVMIDGKGCSWATGSATSCGSNQPQPDGNSTAGHVGNGYARISLVTSS